MDIYTEVENTRRSHAFKKPIQIFTEDDSEAISKFSRRFRESLCPD